MPLLMHRARRPQGDTDKAYSLWMNFAQTSNYNFYIFTFDPDTESLINEHVTFVDHTKSNSDKGAMSPNGKLLVVSTTLTTGVRVEVYDRTGPREYTRRSVSPFSFPAGRGYGEPLFLRDGQHFILGDAADSNVDILRLYHYDADNNISLVSNGFNTTHPARGLATVNSSKMVESPDQVFLIVPTKGTTNNYYVYKRVSPGAFEFSQALEANGRSAVCAAFTPDSQYLYLAGGGTSPEIALYRRNSNDTFTIVDDNVMPFVGGGQGGWITVMDTDPPQLFWCSTNRTAVGSINLEDGLVDWYGDYTGGSSSSLSVFPHIKTKKNYLFYISQGATDINDFDKFGGYRFDLGTLTFTPLPVTDGVSGGITSPGFWYSMSEFFQLD